MSDDPYTRDRSREDDDSSFRPGGAFELGWPRRFRSDDDTTDRSPRDAGGAFDTSTSDLADRDPTVNRADRETSEDKDWLDEGLIATLVIVGVGLFVFPEPATSAVGIFLVVVGVGAWLATRTG